MILSFRYRVKDSSAKRHLARCGIAANQIWNYCCQIQREAESRWKAGRNVRWPTAFDLINLCSGCASELGIHSDTVRMICRQFVASRTAKRKCPKFRSSFGEKRSLLWVPFILRAIKADGDTIRYLKRIFHFWKTREIGGEIKSGCFVEDSRGRWYVVFQCEVEDGLPCGNGKIGIDLGLKTLATCSDGAVIPALRHYRRYEQAIGIAQRAGNKKRVRAIHAKIANARKHHLHEWSSKIARENQFIAVGDVSSSKLAKTKMAKSVLDAGWAMLRNQLRYKSARRQGAVYVDVDERFSSQVCSECGSMPNSRPKGIADLGMRSWECSDCGASHDRDVNAARNILRTGLERQALVGGISVL